MPCVLHELELEHWILICCYYLKGCRICWARGWKSPGLEDYLLTSTSSQSCLFLSLLQRGKFQGSHCCCLELCHAFSAMDNSISILCGPEYILSPLSCFGQVSWVSHNEQSNYFRKLTKTQCWCSDKADSVACRPLELICGRNVGVHEAVD